MPEITLLNEDCLKAIPNMKADSVDLVITDPPYNLGLFMKDRATNLHKMRSNFFGAAGWDDYKVSDWENSMNELFSQLSGVCRKGATLIVFMAIIKVESIIRMAQKYGFYYKTTGIWHKTNPMPRNMNMQFVNSTEAWIYFTYGAKRGTFNNKNKLLHDFVEYSVAPQNERVHGGHPTQKPVKLMKFFVETLSSEGDVILDPFMGSGTTGVAAKSCNRNFIGIELNEKYYEMAKNRINEIESSKPKVIDLFAGVGGMSLGFEQAGFNVVLANEWDSFVARAYKKNFPNTEVIVKDITKLDLQKQFGKYSGEIDVVVGGPPCQGFSQKGKRMSVNDSRNFLFKYYVEVVKIVNPKYFVMENVPNLLTTENGYFKEEIEMLFAKLGYKITADVLNACDYGVPQNRKRAVIIGKKGNTPPKLPSASGIRNTIWDAIGDLAFLSSNEGEEIMKYPKEAHTDYQSKMRKGSTLLHNHVATKHSQIALERLKLIPPECGKESLPVQHRTKSIYSGTWCRMKKNDISVTITTRFDTPSSGCFSHPFLDRAITVREAARIQSFPDTFIFYGSKHSQMKQVGNAVPPMLAKAIADSILNDINIH